MQSKSSYGKCLTGLRRRRRRNAELFKCERLWTALGRCLFSICVLDCMCAWRKAEVATQLYLLHQRLPLKFFILLSKGAIMEKWKYFEDYLSNSKTGRRQMSGAGANGLDNSSSSSVASCLVFRQGRDSTLLSSAKCILERDRENGVWFVL